MRRRLDYLRCYRTGRRVEAAGLRLHVARGQGAEARFGITASRKVGRAVVRQRTRRRVREILRRWPQRETLPALDLVVHLHPSAASLSFDELRVSLEGALERARDLATDPADTARSGARSGSRRRSRR
ncbi:MAG TPA: ribonuclease P protein component [Thermoanaerobaculia bacterium]|nr:ribonuclease P protein component [Thermoanaerobaculia bacterium]